MALSPYEEALVRDLIAQNAALLSLAASEPTILSKLGATKATLSDLPVASSLADTDLFLVRQGTTDRSVPGSAIKTYIDAIIPDGQLPGEVAAFAMSTAPAGWLKANGAAVSRTTYAALFAAIGTAFGAGDGSTTFNLPDLRGEFVRGWDDGRGVDSGRAFGSGQADEIKAHNHSSFEWWAYSNDTTDSHRPGGTIPHLTRNGEDYWGDRNQEVCVTTGGAETRPRNVALLYCIKF